MALRAPATNCHLKSEVYPLHRRSKIFLDRGGSRHSVNEQKKTKKKTNEQQTNKKSTPVKNGCPPPNIDCITDKAHKNPYLQLHSLPPCFSEYCDCFIRVTDCSIRVSQSFLQFTIRKSQGDMPMHYASFSAMFNPLHSITN